MNGIEKVKEKKLRKREAKRKKAYEENQYLENVVIPEIKKRTLKIISEMGQFIPGEVTKMVMLSAGEWIMNPSDDNIKEVIQMELDCWNEQFEDLYGEED